MHFNPWLTRRPLVYAHQGGALEAPSSTMFAFERAVRLGCDALEMDVHRTVDGVLVVSHDETVDQTADRRGKIANLTWEDLKRLDNAHWFVPEVGVPRDRKVSDYVYRGRAPRDRAFGYVRLHDVLDAFPSTFINLDVKATAPQSRPYEVEIAAVLAEHGRGDDVIVASFHDRALASFRAAAPDRPTSLGPDDSLAVGLAIHGEGPEPVLHPSMVALQLPHFFGEIEVVNAAFVAGAHERGLAVHVWTVNDASEIRQLLRLGVDGIITDRPALATTVLADLRDGTSEVEI